MVEVRPRLGWLIAAAFATACTSDEMPAAELAELCGQAGPAQILALDRDEVVSTGFLGTQRIDERTFYGIRRFDHPITNVPISSQPAEIREYAELGARIESIDRCGTDRRVLAEGVDVLLPRADDEPWLAYRSETQELFWIDPEQRWTPRRVLDGEQLLQFVVRGDRVWELDGDSKEIVRHTLAGDQPIRETIFEDVRAMWPPSYDRTWYEHELGELLVLRDNGDLFAVDFATGATEQLRFSSGIGAFATDTTQRWLLTWEVAAGSDPGDPTRSASLTDRDHEGVAYLISNESLVRVAINRDVMSVQEIADDVPSTGPPTVLTTQLSVLPGQQSITLDGDWRVFDSKPVGAFTVSSAQTFELKLLVVDGDELREPFAVYPGDRMLDDALLTSSCAIAEGLGESHERPCDLVTIPYATGKPEVIERDAWTWVATPGNQWIDFDGPEPQQDEWRPDPRGNLVTIDGSSGARALIDRDVSPSFTALEPHPQEAGVWHTDEIVYQVRDLVGDRTGLWRARFE